jgi:formylglycine-generating enzyme required for sulfatase activity
MKVTTMTTARNRGGSLKAAAIVILAVFVGVLVGLALPWMRGRPAADAQQPQPPMAGVTPTPDKDPPPPDDDKPPIPHPKPPVGKDLSNSIGMKFKRIEAGTFMMPALTGVVPVQGLPAQKIPFREPFYMGVYLVTQQEYQTVMGENPSYFKDGGGGVLGGHLKAGTDTKRFPVECVNWGDAQDFCTKLSALPAEKAAGRSYRMPTEWEWDYAARAGTSTTFIFGNDPASGDAYAWFANNSGNQPHPVGLKKSNAWDMYDMQGNLWELLSDPSYPSYMILRGGSWGSEVKSCPAAYRMPAYDTSRDDDDGRYSTIGFRVVCEVGPPPQPANAPVKPPRAKDNADAINRALAQLSTDDIFDQDAACKLLLATKVDGSRRAEVLQAVRKMLDDRDRIRPRVQGIRVLAAWGTAAEVPYLLGLLDDANRSVQDTAIVALGKLKDPRAADTLAKRMNSAWQWPAASESLKEIGPAAESAVREQLRTGNNYARVAAAKVLKVIGSKASQKDLVDAANDYYSDVAQAAREALPPNLRPAVVDPKQCVTLNIHIKNYQAWPAIQAKVKALADAPNPMCQTHLTGDYMWVTLGPVKDYDALLRKIDFGRVTTHRPESRLIYVESGQ